MSKKRQTMIRTSKAAMLEALKGKKLRLSYFAAAVPTTKEISHEVLIAASPKEVFEALMDGKKHAKFTGAAAKIGRKPGSAFQCYGSYITGTTLELQPARLIVQAWRSRNWAKGTHSIVAFRLARAAGGKTKLHFKHVGVPASDYADRNKGWRTHYWEPLKNYLEK